LQRYSSTLNVSRHHPDVIQMLRLFDVHECLRDIEVAGETVIAKIYVHPTAADGLVSIVPLACGLQHIRLHRYAVSQHSIRMPAGQPQVRPAANRVKQLERPPCIGENFRIADNPKA
jgi:hypothetical protein